MSNPYKGTPTKLQAEFNDPRYLEVFWSAGLAAGKTEALIQGAAAGVGDPSWSALLLAPTWTDLVLPGMIRERLEFHFMDEAKCNRNTRTLTFPSGATITYDSFPRATLKDFKYRSALFNYIGIDNPRTLSEGAYRLLLSRVRGTIRLAGSESSEWQKSYFATHGKVISGSTVADNDLIEPAQVMESISCATEEYRKTLLSGDWR